MTFATASIIKVTQNSGMSVFNKNEAGIPPTEIAPSNIFQLFLTDGKVTQKITIEEGISKNNAPHKLVILLPLSLSLA
jgi:hypothetical protein